MFIYQVLPFFIAVFQRNIKQDCLFFMAFFFFLDHLFWPHWTARTQHGSRKQWKLLSFERQAPLWSLKSVEKYRLLLCLLQTRPALTRWALQSCCNQTNQDNTYWLNHWPWRCAEIHAQHVCVRARVCVLNTERIRLLAHEFSTTHSLSLMRLINGRVFCV